MLQVSCRLVSGFWLVAGSAGIGFACCGVSTLGRPLRFGDQTNIIVWNASSHTEHFIRDALFDTDAKDFGFIAPTPSKPELAEASDLAFETLARLRPAHTRSGLFGMMDLVPGAKAVGVIVIQEKDVAGFHATTLLASDSKALANWMRKNGYQTTPAVETWTKFYIAKGWYLTAFKVKNSSEQASTGTVRISFKTDEPFNPYYVPSDNIDPRNKRLLRVFFVSDASYAPTIGHTGHWTNLKWRAPVPDATASRLAQQLKIPASEIPAGAQVESFEDNRFPRAVSDDIYFRPGNLQAEEETESDAGSPLPLPLLEIGGVVVAGVIGVSFASRRRK
jgi:hypothetical protein